MDLQKLGSVLICLLASQGITVAATTLIAGSNIGPYRSTDGGATWKQIFITTNDPALQGFAKLTCLAVDPQNPSNLFAGANFTGPAAFLRSGDGGQTWSVVSKPTFGFKGGAGVLAIDPIMSNVIYASTPLHEIQVSIDGGATWTVPSMPNPLPGLKTSAIPQTARCSMALTPAKPWGGPATRPTEAGAVSTRARMEP